MARYYRARNKRIIPRAANGRFRKATLEDIGIHSSLIQRGPAVCADCGYGSGEEKWHPILKTGYCPKCGSQRKIDENTGDVVKSDVELLEQYINSSFHPLLGEDLIQRGVIDGRETETELRQLLHYMKTGEKPEQPKQPSLMDIINRMRGESE